MKISIRKSRLVGATLSAVTMAVALVFGTGPAVAATAPFTVAEDWGDTSAWTPYVGVRDQELAYYDGSHHTVSNGILTLKAEKLSGKWYSSTIYSKVAFTEGTLKIPVKVPRIKGIWPAVWSIGFDSNGNDWPTKGEFDALEVPGPLLTTSDGKPGFLANIHGVNSTLTEHWQDSRTLPYSSDWIELQIRLGDGFVELGYNGTRYRWSKATLQPGQVWPFKKDVGLRMILGLAVGGWAGTPDASLSSATMQVGKISYRPL